ncbi:MAG: TetR/AcrR family transcriptional regulator [Pseudomonadota bacterium]
MPRVSEAEKRKSHSKILDAAASLFMENGIETTSVAEVMSKAGMTHGGFYRHFSGKDELVAQAFRRAVDNAVSAMDRAETPQQKATARKDYVEVYLSFDHVMDKRNGCPIAALGSEVGRAQGSTSDEVSDALLRVASLLSDGEDQTNGYARLALLVGAVTLARLSADPETAKSVVERARAAYGRV